MPEALAPNEVLLCACVQDTASCVEPSSRPAALPAGVYAEHSATKQTDTAQAGNLDADDDFGPAFEFH